jgi:ubiquitin-like modifier-activating enzyme ATG7
MEHAIWEEHAIAGFFAPCNQPHAPSYLQLMMESLPPDPGVNTGPAEAPYNRNRLPVPGTLHNTNTAESYNAVDKVTLLRTAADKVFVTTLRSVI